VAAEAALPADEVERLYAEGRAMNLEQVLAYAREPVTVPGS
jgi:hypothetical protein